MIGTTRREFLGGAMALAGLSGCRTFEKAFGSPDLRFGLVSDIHVTTRKSAVRFKKALKYFRSRGANAVVVPGDLTDWGLFSSFRYVQETWDSVFAGTDTMKLFCTGNHDFDGYKYGDMTMEMHANGYSEYDANVFRKGGMADAWETAFGEKYAPIRLRKVNGYNFVSVEYYGADRKSGPDLKSWMAANGAELKGDKPFFVFQHLPMTGTTVDSFGWADGGKGFAALKDYPNAIAITGHTHRPFVDERLFWQGEFTAISTPSLSYPCFGEREDHENGGGNRAGKAKQTMQMIPARRDLEGTQGYFVSVYKDKAVFERIDFGESKPVEAEDPWIVPFDGSKPHTLSEIEKREPVPQFPNGATFDYETRNTENRTSHWTIVMRCRFPTAKMPNGKRAEDYEIRAVPLDGTDVMVKKFFSPTYHKLKKYEPEMQDFYFDVADLPQDKAYRLEVYARNCFGKCSRPLVSEILRGKPGLGKVFTDKK